MKAWLARPPALRLACVPGRRPRSFLAARRARVAVASSDGQGSSTYLKELRIKARGFGLALALSASLNNLLTPVCPGLRARGGRDGALLPRAQRH